MDKQYIWQMIHAERERQELLHKPKQTDLEWMPILIEEVGEVGKAIQENSNVVEELVHVAATAIRWLEERK